MLARTDIRTKGRNNQQSNVICLFFIVKLFRGEKTRPIYFRAIDLHLM